MQKIGSSLDPSLDCQDYCCRCYGLASPCEEFVPTEVAVCNLCTVSVEKRIREEQAWRLQKAFQDLLFRFQDWLWAAEVTAASPNSSQVSYANSKKELQRFEVLQRQVSEKLLPLESLNRQYHQLVRSGNVSLQLKSTIQEINQRWDDLQIRIAAIYKRLKYFVNQREEFELERETIQVWLMELDLRLTDVEHFSGGTSLEKITQLQTFQQDVQANAERVDCLLVRGERLIQKSQPEDAEILEEELQDLSCFCQEIFRRVFRFHWRLVSIWLVFEDKWLSDRESDLQSDGFMEESLELTDNGDIGRPLLPVGPVCQSTPKKALLHRRWRVPNLGGAMDLEWDPSVDVGGSTSHDEEEDSSYYSAITGVGQWEEPSQKYRSSHQVQHSLPLKCCSQEDFFTIQPSLPELKILPTLKPCFSPGPQNLPLGKGMCHQPKLMGFDSKHVETWLGQSWQEKMEVQGTKTCRCVPLSAPELHFPMQSQITSQQAKRQKTQQRLKRKSKLTLVTQPGQTGNQQICKRKQDSRSAEVAVTIDKGYDPPPQPLSIQSQKLPRTPAVLKKMLSAFGFLLLLLLASASLLSLSEPSCLQTNGYARSFHLMLKYINGPPPT